MLIIQTLTIVELEYLGVIWIIFGLDGYTLVTPYRPSYPDRDPSSLIAGLVYLPGLVPTSFMIR